MALNFQQKNALKKADEKAILGYLQNDRFTAEDLDEFAASEPSFAEKLHRARVVLDSMPNPNEEREFNSLGTRIHGNIGDPNLKNDINAYIAKWSDKAYAAERIQTANGWLVLTSENDVFNALKLEAEEALTNLRESGILPDNELIERIANFINTYGLENLFAKDVEDAKSWSTEINKCLVEGNEVAFGVVLNSDGSLKDIDDARSLSSRPLSLEQRQRLDELAWVWVLKQEDIATAAVQYKNVFGQNCLHNGDIMKMRMEHEQWNAVDKNDIFKILEYLQNKPNSAFESDANKRIDELKGLLLERLEKKPQSIPVSYFEALLNCKKFDKTELFKAAHLTEDFWKNRVKRRSELMKGKNDINTLQKYVGTGMPGITDVILLGVRNSGKSSVLSGLFLNNLLSYDNRHYNGDYADYICDYANDGIAVPPTKLNFVATVKADVTNLNGRNFSFNLYDIAGEDFNAKIATAQNEDDLAITSFTELGKGAPEIFKTDNEKVIFLVIDPTIEESSRNLQSRAIKAMVTLMFDSPENAEIMKRVRGVHFIVTKADTLDGADKLKAARDVVSAIVNQGTAHKMVKGCNEYGINAHKDKNLCGHPFVYPFSLGSFTVGNMFTYDSEGSDTVLKVICDYSRPIKQDGFLAKLREPFLKPIL